jgi:NADH:ubiquinone oxidoreductase subunit 5 (subunit L)/multisubunit Na+/H+ antiporter MnhA subunit
MFISFSLSLIVFNTTDLSLIFIQTPFLMFHYVFIGNLSVHFLTLFSLTLALSGGIKAAQFFSHVWLPDAMEAPTPASALIHSSTLVVAGVFLIIRFSVVFEFTLFTNYVLILLGAVTLAFGSITATFQQDIKKLVAYSTISQIGYLVCGCGFCCYEEVLLYLIIHALNKAFLFVLVGYTVHFFAGNTDMRQMGGFYIYSFDLTVLFFGVCVNLAGIPYSAGFIGKELLLFQVLRDDFLSLIVRGCWMASFFFTPIYMLMLVFLVLFGPKKANLSVYTTYWNLKFKNYLYLWNKSSQTSIESVKPTTTNNSTPNTLANVLNYNVQTWAKRNFLFNTIRFNFTIATSRLTIYILFFFWCFFFFFGNILISILLNFNTISETIFSTSFTTIKQHTIFTLNTSSMWLSNTIFFYILILTLLSVFFLLNLRYTFTYNYFYVTYVFDYIILGSICLIWLL